MNGRQQGISRIRDGSGFTFLELMVSIALSSLVMVSAFQILGSGQDSQERGTQSADARQNARAALSMMTRDIRMAGSGFGPVAINGSYNGVPFVLHALAPYAGATGISIAGAMDSTQATLRQRMPNSSSILKCVDVNGFAPNDLIIITDGFTAHLFQITKVIPQSNELQHRPTSPYNPPGGHSNWPPQGYGAASSVLKIDIINYYLDESGAVLIRETAARPAVHVAGGIRSLGFQYHMSDGQVTENPADPSSITGVTLTVETGSSALRAGDPSLERLMTRVTPRCLIR